MGDNMKMLSYYLWILEQKICKNKRCYYCIHVSLLEDHCELYDKYTAPNNVCIDFDSF